MTARTTRDGHGASRAIATLLALLLTMAIGAAGGVGAQEEPVEGGPIAIDYATCGHFETQENAQTALDAGNLEHPEFLDADGDGVACEDAFAVEGGPVAVDPTSCGHFETQADAQEALDSGTVPDPENLDGDGDGIACEVRWGDPEPAAEASETSGTEVIALPSTGTGSAVGTNAAASALGGLSMAGALSLGSLALA